MKLLYNKRKHTQRDITHRLSPFNYIKKAHVGNLRNTLSPAILFQSIRKTIYLYKQLQLSLCLTISSWNILASSS